MAGVFTPYTTASPFFGTKPSWIPWELDIMRIQAYQAYEEIYWNVPDTFKISLRGTNELPLYVPSGRTIVEAANRYTAPDFGVSLTTVSQTGQAGVADPLAVARFGAWMRRERFRSKFNGNKRYGLIRGDAVWHITADPDKPAGSRISITALDPGMYFPIPNEEDVEDIVGVHLVEHLTTEEGPRIRRMTYRYGDRRPDGTRPVTVSDGLFEVDKWGGPNDTPVSIIQPEVELPPDITQIPVYHWKNFDEPNNPFGSSEMRGLERLMGGLNQTLSDEDLTLALEGIGTYVTDSSEPIDPRTGQKTKWVLGPGRVAHVDGEFFNRLQGASGLNDSYGAHYDRIWEAMKQAASTPDIAVGRVNVEIAQSGVALRLQLDPILSKTREKNDLIVDVHNQMFYDLTRMWFPAYEADNTFQNVEATCVVGDAVPVDRAARFTELNDMLDRGVIDTEYYRVEAAKLGYVFPDGIGARATAEYAARNQDAFLTRAAGDVDNGES